MRIKNRYIIDNSNRLIIKRKCKSLLADGRFAIDRYNRLVYWLNEPASWQRQYDLPHKITLKGKWWLNSNYDLELILDETKEQYKDERLILKGEIISTDRHTLAFEIKGYDNQGLIHIQLLKLTGSWQADDYNQLSFLVKKKTSPDVLILEGIWQINQNQQIIYTYEKTDLKTKSKTSHVLTFEGFWQINTANKLTYILKHSSDSKFDFRVQIETPNIYPKEGVIKYRLGVGIREERSRDRVFSLYGIWKFSRKAGLNFAMDYGNGDIYESEFGIDAFFDKKDKMTFSLKNKIGEPLGINVIFTHRFLKALDAEDFLRLKASCEESRIDAGVRIPF